MPNRMIVRDFRLWHAGMPNKTDESRVMLVSIQFPKWYRSNQKVLLPKTLQGKMNWSGLKPCEE
ncbi:hypothetical protein BDV97DRAFT_357941 [Delphinella strobiligena]|nr:hypothetical protein BDV97DRAFT_357941 [Delphinella strobiligena]